MSDALMVNLWSADWPEKKGHDRGTTLYHFTSIYLKLITSYYAYILLIAMLYFDRIIQDLKLTKQKYVGLLWPQDFDVTILAKTFCFS